MTTFFFGASMAVVEALGVEAQRAWHMATWWEALAILGVVLLYLYSWLVMMIIIIMIMIWVYPNPTNSE